MKKPTEYFSEKLAKLADFAAKTDFSWPWNRPRVGKAEPVHAPGEVQTPTRDPERKIYTKASALRELRNRVKRDTPSAVAKAIGVNPSIMTRFLAGSTPRMGTIDALLVHYKMEME